MVSMKKRQRADAEIPTSSMSDISFLLLLFFLVTTTIDVDTGIGMVLPEYVENVEVAPVSKDRMIAVLVNENGDVLMDGKQIAIPQIANTLKPRIESKIDLPLNKKLIVSIKTDRKTNYNLYIKTLDQINMAYQEVRDEYSTGKYGKPYRELNDAAQDDVRQKVYKIVSIAEPEKIK